MGLTKIREPFISDLFNYTVEVEFQLAAFKNYIKITEEVINKEINQEIKRCESLEKSCKEAYEELYYFEKHEIAIYTKNLYYNSLLISLYSFFERILYKFCMLAEEKIDNKIRVINDHGIKKYYKYLKENVNINFEKLNHEWLKINKYKELRDILVHSPIPEIQKNDNNLIKTITIRSIDHLTVLENDDCFRFHIDNEKLLYDFHDVIRKFIDEIYHERNKYSI